MTGESTSKDERQHRTQPAPAEPADVDALLAGSLRAHSEEDFAWKEPTRRPRWYERAELQQHAESQAPASQESASTPVRRRVRTRTGQFVFGAVCLLLALWALIAVVFGVVLDPILVALGLCATAGAALVVVGLRPRPGRRL